MRVMRSARPEGIGKGARLRRGITGPAVRLLKRYKLDPASRHGTEILREIARSWVNTHTVDGHKLGRGREKTAYAEAFMKKVLSGVESPGEASRVWHHKDVQPFLKHMRRSEIRDLSGEFDRETEEKLPRTAAAVTNLLEPYGIPFEGIKKIANGVKMHAISTVPDEAKNPRRYKKAWEMWYNNALVESAKVIHDPLNVLRKPGTPP